MIFEEIDDVKEEIADIIKEKLSTIIKNYMKEDILIPYVIAAAENTSLDIEKMILCPELVIKSDSNYIRILVPRDWPELVKINKSNYVGIIKHMNSIHELLRMCELDIEVWWNKETKEWEVEFR